MRTIIVTGGVIDGSIPNEFWYKEDDGVKHGPFDSYEEATEGIKTIRAMEIGIETEMNIGE